MKIKSQIIMFLVLVFIIGFLSGALVSGVFLKNRIKEFTETPSQRLEFLVNQISRTLDMDREQKEDLTGAIQEYLAAIEDEREAFQISIEPENRKVREKIESILRDDQQEKLGQLIGKLYPLFRFNGKP